MKLKEYPEREDEALSQHREEHKGKSRAVVTQV